jgi:hypothetical protein
LSETFRHRPTPWERKFHELPPGFTVTELPDTEGFVVFGPCPGCGGRIRKEWPYGSGNGYKGVFNRSKPSPVPAPGPRVVRCICGNVHEDRPATEQYEGCGAYWSVYLP